MSIFESMIASLNKVNDSYTIYDLGNHCFIKDNFTKSYKKFGLKELNYDYAFFDSGDPKFIYIRQNYSFTSNSIKKMPDSIKPININKNKILGFNC